MWKIPYLNYFKIYAVADKSNYDLKEGYSIQLPDKPFLNILCGRLLHECNYLTHELEYFGEPTYDRLCEIEEISKRLRQLYENTHNIEKEKKSFEKLDNTVPFVEKKTYNKNIVTLYHKRDEQYEIEFKEDMKKRNEEIKKEREKDLI